MAAMMLHLCDCAHVVEDDATAAPTMVKEGPLAPCVQRYEYHKVVMTKTLISVSFAAFFLGVCCCTICGGFCWCASARISMSEDGRLEQSLDPKAFQSRIREWRQLLKGEKRNTPDEDFGIMLRRQRYERLSRNERDASDKDGDKLPRLEDAQLV